MKKWIAVLLVLLLSAVYPAAQAERWAQIPEPLRFSQYTAERDYVKSALYVQCTYPNTANAAVNQEMKELIDRMAQEGRKALPAGPYNEKRPTYLDVGAYISRSGDRFMSFLTIARIAHNTEQTYVDFDARTYDMLSGRQITLRDLFDADSEAWALLADEVRGQLTAYYMDLIPDLTALDALCTREAIESAPITLSAAKLSLHYRTDALYPGKNNLMHVNLYYSGIRSLMNSLGQQATDNSHYKMIALTYDDGGARGSSMNVLNQLRLYGAKATFFIIGTNMVNNHDVMNRQQDADFAMASHNYEHVEHVSDPTGEKIPAWKERFDREMDSIVGIRPAYMRAPGGNWASFINGQVGLPLIQWSGNSTDAGKDDVNRIARMVLSNARDGAIILMHDLNTHAHQYAAIILPELEAKGFLCVTVDELFDHYGVELKPNTLYYSAEEAAAAMP